MLPRTCSEWTLTILCMLTVSCAAVKVEVPTYEGRDIRDELAGRELIRSMVSTFEIEAERVGQVMKGDAVLRMTRETLDLQVYSLGFLVAEVTSVNGGTKSDPPLDKNRLLMFVDGLRNSFFWWSIREAEISETPEAYRVWNSWRRLLVNKRTLMPERQIIELEDGRELSVTYEDPALLGEAWFPSKMRIELPPHVVNLRIKTVSFDAP